MKFVRILLFLACVVMVGVCADPLSDTIIFARQLKANAVFKASKAPDQIVVLVGAIRKKPADIKSANLLAKTVADLEKRYKGKNARINNQLSVLKRSATHVVNDVKKRAAIAATVAKKKALADTIKKVDFAVKKLTGDIKKLDGQIKKAKGAQKIKLQKDRFAKKAELDQQKRILANAKKGILPAPAKKPVLKKITLAPKKIISAKPVLKISAPIQKGVSVPVPLVTPAPQPTSQVAPVPVAPEVAKAALVSMPEVVKLEPKAEVKSIPKPTPTESTSAPHVASAPEPVEALVPSEPFLTEAIGYAHAHTEDVETQLLLGMTAEELIHTWRTVSEQVRAAAIKFGALAMAEKATKAVLQREHPLPGQAEPGVEQRPLLEPVSTVSQQAPKELLQITETKIINALRQATLTPESADVKTIKDHFEGALPGADQLKNAWATLPEAVKTAVSNLNLEALIAKVRKGGK